MVAQTYLALFLATTLYALVLAWLKRKWEPDLTWIEVAIGVAICMGAPAWLARAGLVESWQVYEQYAFLAFIVGGFPIAIWQTIHNRRAADATRDEAKRLLAQERGHADASDTLAE